MGPKRRDGAARVRGDGSGADMPEVARLRGAKVEKAGT